LHIELIKQFYAHNVNIQTSCTAENAEASITELDVYSTEYELEENKIYPVAFEVTCNTFFFPISRLVE